LISGSVLSLDLAYSSPRRPVAALALDRRARYSNDHFVCFVSVVIVSAWKAFVCLVQIDHLDFGLVNLNCLVRGTTALAGAQLLINFATA